MHAYVIPLSGTGSNDAELDVGKSRGSNDEHISDQCRTERPKYFKGLEE